MKAFTVFQVNEYIAKKLRDDLNLRGLAVEGEISGLSKSGQHLYFSLKDADSILRCAIWASNLKGIDTKLLENGKKIIVVGDISAYSKGGNYSLSIRHVEAAGEGDLMAEFNRIKEKLMKEGLFDNKYKKPIPEFPKTIGVVTSSTGAAIEDIKKIITRKNNYTDIIIFPTQVQGIAAVDSICSNIVLANELNKEGQKIDTLIVGRGGGSPEDLMAFNDERVARAIFASEIPVISAVGHESDFSISDFVADLRAETPTAAAEIAVMDTYALADEINQKSLQLLHLLKIKLESQNSILNSSIQLLNSNMNRRILEYKSKLDNAIITLNENNPRNILNKGYSLVSNSTGEIISDIDQIDESCEYTVMLKNGSFTATVKSKERS